MGGLRANVVEQNTRKEAGNYRVGPAAGRTPNRRACASMCVGGNVSRQMETDSYYYYSTVPFQQSRGQFRKGVAVLWKRRDECVSSHIIITIPIRLFRVHQSGGGDGDDGDYPRERQTESA